MSGSGEAWRARAGTVHAIGLLLAAKALVRLVPWSRWRGFAGSPQGRIDLRQAHYCARVVERAALRLPLATRCLHRALALGWLLRSAGLRHSLIIAVRPAALRGDGNGLHAWVEVDGTIVLGALPGPWSELWRTPGEPRRA